MWGCYLTGMWLYRLGLTKAKEYALTGRPLSGPRRLTRADQRRRAVRAPRGGGAERARLLATIPLSQLAAMKLIVNQAYENMGLASTQLLGPVLDGLMRNTPEAHDFIELAESEGVSAAVARRDAPFGDYSQAPAAGKPDPANAVDRRALAELPFRVWSRRCLPTRRRSGHGTVRCMTGSSSSAIS